MARYVIDPGTARALAASRTKVTLGCRLLAPTLLRSQLLAVYYAAVQGGELTRREAQAQLDFVRSLQVRLLGDRVLQGLAWDMAQQLGWRDTFVAEYLALTRLQADAFVTTSPELARAAGGLVPVVGIEALRGAST